MVAGKCPLRLRVTASDSPSVTARLASSMASCRRTLPTICLPVSSARSIGTPECNIVPTVRAKRATFTVRTS